MLCSFVTLVRYPIAIMSSSSETFSVPVPSMVKDFLATPPLKDLLAKPYQPSLRFNYNLLTGQGVAEALVTPQQSLSLGARLSGDNSLYKLFTGTALPPKAYVEGRHYFNAGHEGGFASARVSTRGNIGLTLGQRVNTDVGLGSFTSNIGIYANPSVSGKWGLAPVLGFSYDL